MATYNVDGSYVGMWKSALGLFSEAVVALNPREGLRALMGMAYLGIIDPFERLELMLCEWREKEEYTALDRLMTRERVGIDAVATTLYVDIQFSHTGLSPQTPEGMQEFHRLLAAQDISPQRYIGAKKALTESGFLERVFTR